MKNNTVTKLDFILKNKKGIFTSYILNLSICLELRLAKIATTSRKQLTFLSTAR